MGLHQKSNSEISLSTSDIFSHTFGSSTPTNRKRFHDTQPPQMLYDMKIRLKGGFIHDIVHIRISVNNFPLVAWSRKIIFFFKHTAKTYEMYLFEPWEYRRKSWTKDWRTASHIPGTYFKWACIEDHTWWAHLKYMGIPEMCDVVLQSLIHNFFLFILMAQVTQFHKF